MQKREKSILCGTVCVMFLLSLMLMYVTAAETQTDPAEKTMAKIQIEYEDDIDDRTLIRRANEDGIYVDAMAVSKTRSLSEKEYGILTRIVEAEATDKDNKSKILVANVVLNRMADEEFPDTVEEVVFQRVAGVTQFSPVADGRYYTVDVTESTKESVDRALAGEDYSEGALYFMERSMSDAKSVAWFDRELTKLFEYEGHEFYR